MKIDRANTILYCRHWTETVAFYRDVLELVPVFVNDWFVEFEICPGAFVSIANAARATIKPVDGQGSTITLRMSDLTEVHASLVAASVRVTDINHRWGASSLFCWDPEGHRLEFWTDTPTD
ncbi:MAG: VOC family protein [Ilumatobacteraceae bacterium]